MANRPIFITGVDNEGKGSLKVLSKVGDHFVTGEGAGKPAQSAFFVEVLLEGVFLWIGERLGHLLITNSTKGEVGRETEVETIFNITRKVIVIQMKERR